VHFVEDLQNNSYNLAFRYDPMGAKNPSLNLSSRWRGTGSERGETCYSLIALCYSAAKVLIADCRLAIADF
jgi:hypothetical protein